MAWKTIAAACLSLVLVSCATVGERYTYSPIKPNEQPATIDYIYGTNPQPHTTLRGTKWTMFDDSVRLYQVNGKYVYTNVGASEEQEALIKKNKIYLSPGETKITLLLRISASSDDLDFVLNVKPGEHYKLKIDRTEQQVTKENILISTAGKVLVTDSAGTILKEVGYSQGTVTYYPTPYYKPAK